MRLPGFVGPSYTLRSVSVDCQRTVNLYPEIDELGTAKNGEVGALVSRPYLSSLGTAGNGPGRGVFTAANGRSFCVSKNELYEITDPTAAALLGTLLTQSGPVFFADNGTQLMIADGADAMTLLTYATNVVTRVTPDGFTGAEIVDYQDSYFLAVRPDTQQFFQSAINNGSSWDALDFDSAEADPDDVVSILVDHRQLVVFGDESTEVWADTGKVDGTSFSRIDGAYLEHGIVGLAARSKMDNGVFWWAKDRNGRAMAFRLDGYTGRRISTHAVEKAVEGYGDVSGATCYTLQMGGHSFWITDFPGAGTTWVYDAATGMWCEWQSSGDRFRGQYHAMIGTRHVCQDYQNGNLYELLQPALDTEYSDDGAEITRLRRTPHVGNEMKWTHYPEIEIDMETGTGPTLSNADGSMRDPLVMLRVSRDGGHTWGNEHTASIGRIGEYRKRVMFRRMGRARDAVFEIKVTDKVPVTFISGLGQAEFANA